LRLKDHVPGRFDLHEAPVGVLAFGHGPRVEVET
jgi:hypothetical protein